MEALTHSQDFRCTLQVLGIQINDLDVPSDLRCMHLLPSRFFTSAPGISNRVCPETHGVKLIIPPILPAFENDHPHSYVNQTPEVLSKELSISQLAHLSLFRFCIICRLRICLVSLLLSVPTAPAVFVYLHSRTML